MSDSLITKKAMAESLKELMKKKSLEKITISDIVKSCGLNRQTFYYHFKDKYDLINWIYHNEVITTFSQVSSSADWSNVILKVLNIMEQDKSFYIGALSAAGQNIFHNYYCFSETREMLLKIVDEVIATIDEDYHIDPADRIFISEFYTYGLVGMMIQWAKNGMKEPPDEIVGRLKHIFDESKLFSAERYLKTFHNNKDSD